MDAHQSSITLSAKQVHDIFTVLVQVDVQLAVKVVGMMGAVQPTARIIPPVSGQPVRQHPRPTASPIGTKAEDVTNALTALGYTKTEAKSVLGNVNLLGTLDECILEALQYLGSAGARS